MSLVSDADYKYYLKIGQAETITNTLSPFISAVEKRVKEFLNRDLEWAAYTDEIYDGNGKNSMVLRQFPVVYVSAIKRYDGITSGNVETWTTLVEHTDYDRLVILVEAYKVFLDNGSFECGNQNYKITYYAGYTSGATLVSGNPVIGKKYQIAARNSVDFTTIGASANTVGTQFVATGTGVTCSATDSLTELITVPEDIQLACKELVKVAYDRSLVSGNNRLGLLNVSDNAGGGTQTLNLDPEIENKILKRIEGYKANNV